MQNISVYRDKQKDVDQNKCKAEVRMDSNGAAGVSAVNPSLTLRTLPLPVLGRLSSIRTVMLPLQ